MRYNSNDIYDKIYNYLIDRNVAIKFAIITLFLTIKFEFKVVLPDFQQQKNFRNNIINNNKTKKKNNDTQHNTTHTPASLESTCFSDSDASSFAS